MVTEPGVVEITARAAERGDSESYVDAGIEEAAGVAAQVEDEAVGWRG